MWVYASAFTHFYVWNALVFLDGRGLIPPWQRAKTHEVFQRSSVWNMVCASHVDSWFFVFAACLNTSPEQFLIWHTVMHGSRKRKVMESAHLMCHHMNIICQLSSRPLSHLMKRKLYFRTGGSIYNGFFSLADMHNHQRIKQ